ncbi:MAG TPA: hypothetical protein VGE51_11375 [Fontimonas sp.]
MNASAKIDEQQRSRNNRILFAVHVLLAFIILGGFVYKVTHS